MIRHLQLDIVIRVERVSRFIVNFEGNEGNLMRNLPWVLRGVQSAADT
jgi:hypothetical protein